ncbi:uncharacterized protein LOC132728442 [Ruditapes philippinarum]|uniref:uncharacterized protein LOC132728442 n=1 Tax=Ruditapes philippinarum TaxID=129788 RepID=UPI00295A7E4C|nr:uncharacterized protein LOC132728442 [Ruditapes philippinarum]
MLTTFLVNYVSILLVVLPCTILGHIRLTYPEARKYSLDFLNMVQAPAPCGMPKGLGPITDLKTGETITVTWHQPFVHVGGFSLSLLDENEKTIHNFTDGFVMENDPTALWYNITLPDTPCYNCSIQVQRQGKEFPGTVPCNNNKMQFYTCADVNIKSNVDYDRCSSHGTFIAGSCQCDRLYTGHICQYKDECIDDADCKNGGKCEIGVSTTYPKNHCYCASGYFGRTCEKQSSVTSLSNLDMDDYTMTSVANSEFKIYHRILLNFNELEVMARVKTVSWVGVGWKPTNLLSGCKNMLPLLLPFPDKPEGSCNEQFPGNSSTSGVPVTGMDCMDLVVGTARGSYSRIADYYTRDRSAPRFDSFYGGEDSLTAAIGDEVDGYTRILFRRKLQASDVADYDITNSTMHVSWARGQKETARVDYPGTSPSLPYYYNKDDLKKHDRDGATFMNRGFFRINFYDCDSVNCKKSSSADSSKLSLIRNVWWFLVVLIPMVPFIWSI